MKAKIASEMVRFFFFLTCGGDEVKKEQIVYIPVKRLNPYKHNPRKNKEAIDAVAASIKEYGFRSPLQVTPDGTIINGHTRFAAAKKLGIDEVPCVIVNDLSEEQVKGYRLIDNKSSEYATWDKDLLAEELTGLDLGTLDFGFDFTKDVQKQKKWEESKKRCDLKDRIAVRKANDAYYESIFRAGTQGKPLRELKTEENVKFFGETALEFIRGVLGGNLSEADWCLVTTPRRRHGEGFHFATAVCEYVALELRIPFYPDFAVCLNKDRTHPHFRFDQWPKERNVLLYDDILTTGCTVKATRDPLVVAGYNVFTVISIDNH
ncbi:MAG: ParB N-terminal domain-containing protein [Selenomonadaceae bacterium]|nr:ParB N-terminal domain-containing protein [Selenomonadaceae bacterium]